MTFKVEILDPKAKKLLLEMESQKLISLTEENEKSFMDLVKRIRKRGLNYPIEQNEIIREVELVRGKRYAKKKRQGNN
jgi:hypothetical protein